MRTIAEVREELALATDERSRLWTEASRATAAERARLTRTIEALWQELRAAEAHARSGPAELIVRRAQREQRLEQAIAKRLEQRPAGRKAA